MVEDAGFIKSNTFPLMRYEEAKARVATLLGRLDVLLSVDIWKYGDD